MFKDHLSPFLKTSITFITFKIFGKIPVWKESLISELQAIVL